MPSCQLSRKYEAAKPSVIFERPRELATNRGLALDLYRPYDCIQSRVRLKIYSPEKPVTLSDVLIMEKMGFRLLPSPFSVPAEKMLCGFTTF